MEITVLTHSYNRGKDLKKLYNSLLRQTNLDFNWFIIDDGSSDNTKQIVTSFIDEKKIDIIYLKQKQGGKHRALNNAIKRIKTPLVFIVDSDDWLTEDAIDTILQVHNRYKNDKSICGYSFLRKNSKEQTNGRLMICDEYIDNYIDARINRMDMNADKAEVWKTECLKEYPFPEFFNEKFIGEDVVWIPLALKYNMVFLNKPIYYCEYLDNGLTNNRRKNNLKSPNGCCYRALVTLKASREHKIIFSYKAKCMMQYQIYGYFAHKKFVELYKESPYKLLFLLLSPAAFLLYLSWNRKARKVVK